jgi:hypothetical protein
LIFLGCTLGLSWRSWKGRVKFSIPFIIGTSCKSYCLKRHMCVNSQRC